MVKVLEDAPVEKAGVAASDGSPAAESTDSTALAGTGSTGSSATRTATPGVTTADGRPVPSARGATSGSTTLGRGVKADRIILGWEGLADTTEAATRAVGVSASETSEADQRAQIQAMIDDLNKRGGIGGKRVEMIFHFVDVTQGTAESRGQQSCEFFTTDHEIFALVMEANHNQAMSRCMAQRKTPVIDVSSTVLPVDQKDLDEHAPYLYLPLHVNVSRLGATIDAMAQQGFLGKDAKVGLLRYDYPTHVRARDQAIVPALARHGVRLTDDFAFTVVREVSDLGAAGSQAANAVLRFKAEGVNRVLFLPSGWVILTVFPPAAESQGFRPRYGVDSWESPDYLLNNAAGRTARGRRRARVAAQGRSRSDGCHRHAADAAQLGPFRGGPSGGGLLRDVGRLLHAVPLPPGGHRPGNRADACRSAGRRRQAGGHVLLHGQLRHLLRPRSFRRRQRRAQHRLRRRVQLLQVHQPGVPHPLNRLNALRRGPRCWR